MTLLSIAWFRRLIPNCECLFVLFFRIVYGINRMYFVSVITQEIFDYLFMALKTIGLPVAGLFKG